MTRNNQTSDLQTIQYYTTILFETVYPFHKDNNFDEGIFMSEKLDEFQLREIANTSIYWFLSSVAFAT